MSKDTKGKQAHEAIVRARTQLLITQPFFGCLALHLELIECTSPALCQTMGVNGVSMIYWPEFVLGLKEQELVGVVAHEVMHCAMNHMSRRGTRDPQLFNIANDIVINKDLLKANFTLPFDKTAPLIKALMQDPKWDDLSSEEIYARLYDTVEKIKQMIGAAGEGGEGQNNDPGGFGMVMDAGKNGNKAEQDNIAREWEANVRMAVNVAQAANAGKVPAYLERLVKQLKAPRISWRDLTRQFIDASMTKDYTWARPNRRYISQGTYMPGFISDSLNHLVFVGDVSGSISEAVMRAYVSEVAGALDDGVADKLTVIYADTHVRHVDEFMQGDVVTCRTVGGGGTDFNDSFRWIREHAPDASAVVYLTDMMPNGQEGWGTEPDCPMLWGAFVSESYLKGVKVPFGQVVHVDGGD